MYKYAIIGFGGLGKLHLCNLLKIANERKDFELAALCGADPSTFKDNVKLNLGDLDISNIDFSGIHFYQDYKEMIEKEDLDFVLSTLPTHLHKEVAEFALNKGLHVLSEKPMALSIEDCDAMIDAAKRTGSKLMIGHCLRFNPAFLKLKEYVDNKTFGKALRAEFSRYSQTPLWTWNNWILDPEKSGGCPIDMHIHDTDLINWMFGMPNSIRSVTTENKTKLESMFTQYFYDGLFVMANADWSMTQTFPFEARCIVNFEEATVVILGENITVYKDDESFVPYLLGESNMHYTEVEAFLKYALDDIPCEITSPESIRNTVKLALAEIESAKNGGKTITF